MKTNNLFKRKSVKSFRSSLMNRPHSTDEALWSILKSRNLTINHPGRPEPCNSLIIKYSGHSSFKRRGELKISIKLSLIAFIFTAIPIPAAICNTPIDTGNLTDTVKIGLLIQDNKSHAASDGAAMAVKIANQQSSNNKILFSLIVRSMEGPWGTGSKQAASLIFDEKVAALIGSSDGRNAHLAEQVATKVQVVFLSAWSGDPTLAQAFVPWFYSCTPNNDTQSEALFKEIYQKQHFENVTFISDNGYDSNLALRSFSKITDETGRKKPVKQIYDGTVAGCRSILDDIKKNNTNCVILSCEPSSAKVLLEQIRKNKIQIAVYGTLSLLDERNLKEEDLKYFESCSLITSGHWFGAEGSKFRKDFYRTYGYQPGAVAAFAYDGTRIIIEAIRNAGSDREKIQAYLSGIKHKGVTGEISFDEKGNREGQAIIMNIKNGIPFRISE
jgi:branched-chain amino acid transport system substrate-binding protein